LSWNRERVAQRLKEACDTLRRLPEQTVRGYISSWPEMIADVAQGEFEGAVVSRLAAASPQAIDRMHEVFGWFVSLKDKPHLAIALWLTSGRGMGPARAGKIIGAHRDTVRRRRDEALDQMVAALNAKRIAA
jgi:hypothetical protein